MTGTIINVVGILAGGLIGLLLKKGIPDHINAAIMRTEGLAIAIIALNGVIASMFSVTETGRLTDSGGLLLLVSLVLGCLAGELLCIETAIENFGNRIEQRFKASGFARGFISASLVFCIGAMSIIGALNDGLTGDSSILIIKATLDFTTAIVLAAALGAGVMFAAVPVLLLQGGISLLAGSLSAVLAGALLDHICMVGYALVLCIGLNFLFDLKIKVANLLPALLVPIGYQLFF
jgi:uncharacterized membrane protein YqgA involved in biofilm formation